MDLTALTRFQKSEDRFKLTKKASKRSGSMVFVGETTTGDFSLIEHVRENETFAMIMVTGRGFEFIRTSPVVKIVDQDENSTTFETEGGVYKVERIVEKKLDN